MVKFGMEMGPRYHFGGMKVAQGPEVCAKQDFGVILNGLGGEFRAHFRDLKDHFGRLFSINFEDRFESAFVAVLCAILGAFWLHFRGFWRQ